MAPSPHKPSGRIRLNPLSLELLVSVVKEGTIAAAAERHRIAASAVSKRLSDLETVLEIPLIRRANRGIEPTAAGSVLVDLARNVLNGLDDIYYKMREYSEGIRGHVRLMASRSSIIRHLPSELKSFSVRHPNIQVQLEERISSAVIRSVLEEEAEIGLFVLEEPPTELELLPYHDDRLVLITPKSHPLAAKGKIRFAETLEYDFIGFHEEATMQLHQAARRAKRTISVRMQISSIDSMWVMVAAGLGIGILPSGGVPVNVADHDLCMVELDEPWIKREMKIGMRSYARLPGAARLLADHLAEAARTVLRA